MKNENSTTEKEKREKLEKAFIAQATKMLTEKTWDTNWSLVSGMSMFSELPEET
jgi:hypothetical protein